MERDKQVMANHVHGAVRTFFNWCRDQKLITRSPVDGVKAPGHEVPRHRVLTDNELRAVWAGATEIGYPFGDVVKLLILTAQRRLEIANMRWAEVSPEALEGSGAVLRLPQERVKNKRPHELPLPEAVVAILRSLPRVDGGGDWVFTSNGVKPTNAFSKSKSRLDKICGVNASTGSAWTLHDLRRTAASGMARLGIALHVIEKILNHQHGQISGVAAIYNRYSFMAEQREALERWSRFVLDLVAK
jgi:integrase